MTSTPCAAQSASSDALIALDALLISGKLVPTPAQNCFIPPPVPVDSTLGVLKPVERPNRSATSVVKGYTVEEPTTLIWSRCAQTGEELKKQKTRSADRIRDICILLNFGSKVWAPNYCKMMTEI